jgi:hypothetical protein
LVGYGAVATVSFDFMVELIVFGGLVDCLRDLSPDFTRSFDPGLRALRVSSTGTKFFTEFLFFCVLDNSAANLVFDCSFTELWRSIFVSDFDRVYTAEA